VGQWVESGHSNILLFPAQRDGCVSCHDGGAFALEQTEQAELERDFFIAIDCRACHTGRGVELMEAGTVSIPTAENVAAGTGAQCLACHNERRAPNIEDENRSAPHNSSQAGVFTATGGIRVEGVDYGSTTAHVNIDNTCVGCHMTVGEGGFQSHTFRVDDVQASCGDCHQDIQNVNLQARNDYDGDGETKGFQDEVEGLLNLLEAAIADELDDGTFEVGGGRIQFKDAAGEDVEVPNEVYLAAYNHTLVTNDGSFGIHNPLFTLQLLQSSYRALTGEDVPDAEIR
jgi:nitrate/TMAO reductase-like tetraheme cytochrome c subunit